MSIELLSILFVVVFVAILLAGVPLGKCCMVGLVARVQLSCSTRCSFETSA